FEDLLAEGFGYAGAGVGDLDQDHVTVQAGAHGEGAGAGHRVQGVVDEVGPDLVQLGGVGGDPGEAAVVVLDQGDPVVQQVVEHDQGGVEAVVHVDPLVWGAVELGVLLGRLEQLGDP